MLKTFLLTVPVLIGMLVPTQAFAWEYVWFDFPHNTATVVRSELAVNAQKAISWYGNKDDKLFAASILEILGKKDWELVQVIENPDGYEGETRYWLKRP